MGKMTDIEEYEDENEYENGLMGLFTITATGEVRDGETGELISVETYETEVEMTYGEYLATVAAYGETETP